MICWYMSIVGEIPINVPKVIPFLCGLKRISLECVGQEKAPNACKHWGFWTSLYYFGTLNGARAGLCSFI